MMRYFFTSSAAPCSDALKVVRTPGKGRGVRAGAQFYRGDEIEHCPAIYLKSVPSGKLSDYVFSTANGAFVMALNKCAMFNHSSEPNAQWNVVGNANEPDSWYVNVYALQDIAPGEEIFIDYGPGYWSSRPHMKQR